MKDERKMKKFCRRTLLWFSRKLSPLRESSCHLMTEDKIPRPNIHNEHTSSSSVCQPSTVASRSQTSGDTVVTGKTLSSPVPSDLCSAAYQEAVSSFGEEVQRLVLDQGNIERLLSELQKTNKELAEGSMFRRGLQRLQEPLKTIKLALDVVQPLSNINPAASTAIGIVSGVTMIAIAVCGAEESLDASVIQMLEQIAIIDECDVLGQRLGADHPVHRALVPVYEDLLRFYIAVWEIVTSKPFVYALLRDQLRQQLPKIVSEFVEHTALLRSRIGNATLGLLQDIQERQLDDKISKILGPDEGKRRSELHCQILKLKADEACNWIVEDPKFLEWYRASDARRMVLFGALGCGKTFVTGHVIQEVIKRNKYHLPHPLICYHYCERSQTGNMTYIFSSLILQLLDQQKSLKINFNKRYTDIKEQDHFDPAQSSEHLKAFLQDHINNLDRELFIIIDALDECDRNSQRELITLFNDISSKAPRFKVFLSSRPNVQIKELLSDYAQIDWTPDQDRDAIIVQRAVKDELSEYPSDIRMIVTKKLSHLARGCAIWVKFSIALIGRKNIYDAECMREFLEAIPTPRELSQLYAATFAQRTEGDPDNPKLVARALEILAVARRPLSMQELEWAVAISEFTQDIQAVSDVERLVHKVRVLNLLQPFISQIDFGDRKKRQVQLVHQSLRDVILEESPLSWSERSNGNSGGNKGPGSVDHDSQHRQAILEANLLDVCVKYLLLDEIGREELFTVYQKWAFSVANLSAFSNFDDSSTRPGQIEAVEENVFYDPSEHRFGAFFVYASCFWIAHFSVAAAELLPTVQDFIKLCSAKSIRLQNWWDQRSCPDCTMVPMQMLDHNDLDPLVIASLYGTDAALDIMLQNCDLNSINFLEDSVDKAMEKISTSENPSRLNTIFQKRASWTQFSILHFAECLIAAWERSSRDDTMIKLLREVVITVFDSKVRKGYENDLLLLAIRSKCLPLVKMLFEETAHNLAWRNRLLSPANGNESFRESQWIMGSAIRWGDAPILCYLLKQHGLDDDLRRRDSRGKNIFHIAAAHGSLEEMTFLISHWKDGVDQPDNDGDTALWCAVHHNRTEITEALLVSGNAIVNDCCRGGQQGNEDDPLRIAVRHANIEMCRTLVLKGGAKPWSALKIDESGRIVLKDKLTPPSATEELASRVLETLRGLASIDIEVSVSEQQSLY